MSVEKNSVSTRNSSTRAISNGDSFVGGWEDALHYDTLSITLSASANCTLQINQSIDGSNVDFTESIGYVTGASVSVSRPLISKYFRVGVEADSGAVSTLGLQTIMRLVPAMPGTIAIEPGSNPIVVSADALDIRGLSENSDGVGIWGTDGTTLRHILTSATGALQVDVLSAPTTTVTATALDIRPLTAVDVVTIIQGGGLTVDLNSQLGGQNYYRNLSVIPTASQVGYGGLAMWSLSASNVNATACYLKLYNSVASVDETATPVLTYRIPAVSGQISHDFQIPFLFTDGLWLRATTGVADNSTGAPSANDVIVNIGWQ
jgi:hypothetical protein